MADIDKLIQKAKPSAPSKFIIMGDPMTGKTTLAAKAPKPLFISTDGNAAKAGLDAIAATDLNTVREVCISYFPKSDYETLVIDTIEGIADLFERTVIDAWNQETGQAVTALTDVPYGKLTGQFNRRIAAFAETLWSLPKNVMVLTYTKRQVDDVSGSIVLSSELRSIRQFTRFADGIILTSFDGEKYKAGVVSKRTVMAGEVEYGDIKPFLNAAGWEMPKAVKTKVGTARK
jgi:hypothetical protein